MPESRTLPVGGGHPEPYLMEVDTLNPTCWRWTPSTLPVEACLRAGTWVSVCVVSRCCSARGSSRVSVAPSGAPSSPPPALQTTHDKVLFTFPVFYDHLESKRVLNGSKPDLVSTPLFICNPFSSDSILFNENNIPIVIAELLQR